MATVGEVTRNESYETELPVAANKRLQVLWFVRQCGDYGATREDIAEGTGLKLSSVCGRVKELLDTCELVETGTRTGSSGKPNSVLRVNMDHQPTREHVEALKQYMGRGYVPVGSYELAKEIVALTMRGADFPKGSQQQWLAAVTLGVEQGHFVIDRGNIKLAPMPVEESQGAVKQLDLF